MNEQDTTELAHGRSLTDDELTQVSGGGDGGPGNPGDNNGAVAPDSKATPIIF